MVAMLEPLGLLVAEPVPARVAAEALKAAKEELLCVSLHVAVTKQPNLRRWQPWLRSALRPQRLQPPWTEQTLPAALQTLNRK